MFQKVSTTKFHGKQKNPPKKEGFVFNEQTKAGAIQKKNRSCFVH